MTNSYVAKVKAKRRLEFHRARQITLGMAMMVAVGAIGVYIATVLSVHDNESCGLLCGCPVGTSYNPYFSFTKMSFHLIFTPPPV